MIFLQQIILLLRLEVVQNDNEIPDLLQSEHTGPLHGMPNVLHLEEYPRWREVQ